MCEKEETKCNIIIKQCKNDSVRKENIKKHNENWPQISDHPYRIMIIGGFGSEKTHSLFNLIIYQPDTNKIYLYAKNPYKEKCQLLINKTENTGLQHFNNSKDFIEYLDDIGNIYKNIEEYNPNEECKILIKFDKLPTCSAIIKVI